MASSRMGISRGGVKAEDRYRLLTGAAKCGRSGDGDALLGGCNIEVKHANADTLNQVRAVKYIPLVAYHEPTNRWFVVPAHVVVCLVAGKTRGQHTENPFESATLSISALSGYVVPEADLGKETIKAIAKADKYPDLKASMQTVLKESRELATRSVTEVRAIIGRLKIRP